MIKKEEIDSTTIVKELLECYPQVKMVFIERGLLCVGCPTEEFHTIADVSREYNDDLNELLQKINKAVRDNRSS